MFLIEKIFLLCFLFSKPGVSYKITHLPLKLTSAEIASVVVPFSWWINVWTYCYK